MGVIMLTCILCNENYHEDDCITCDECDGSFCYECATWKYSRETHKYAIDGGCPNCRKILDREKRVQEICDKILNKVPNENKKEIEQYFELLISML